MIGEAELVDESAANKCHSDHYLGKYLGIDYYCNTSKIQTLLWDSPYHLQLYNDVDKRQYES